MKTNNQLRMYSVPILLANALICDTELPCTVLLFDTQSVSNLGVEFVLTIDFIIFINMELFTTSSLLGISLFCTSLWFWRSSIITIIFFIDPVCLLLARNCLLCFLTFALCSGSVLFTVLFISVVKYSSVLYHSPHCQHAL